MSKRSGIFKEGQRIGDTLLTVVGPLNSDSWKLIIVQCECGKELVISYQVAYMGTRYSCGCRRRQRTNRVDYTGLTISNRRGNNNSGRKLRVLGEDDKTQQWQYICECCAETFLVPRGLETHLARALKDISGETCPNYRVFYPTERIEMLVNVLGAMGYQLPPVALRLERAKMLAKYYDLKHVKQGPMGFPLGLYGLPDHPLPKAWMPSVRARIEQEQKQQQTVAEQFDEFGDT